MHSSTSLQHLKKLNGILNYSHSGVDYSFGVPYLYQITLGLVLIVSMAFTPYVLYLLARLGKRGWLTFFGILMAMVIGVAWLLGSAGGPWEIVTGLFFFLFLLLFMWLLRLRVNEWIAEARYERNLRMKKMQQKARPGF